MDLEEMYKYRAKLAQIPLELVNILLTNHGGKKKTLMEGVPVKVQQKTKDVLESIKKQNNLRSMSDVIDSLIATVSMQQVVEIGDIKKLKMFDKDLKKDMIENKGVTRTVVVNNREFYSVGSVARTYKITRQTVINRIKDLKTYKWRSWNYADEDIAIKYDPRRVEMKED